MKVSVRALCEFAAREGSLEFRYTPAPTALEGIIGHQTVQERRPDPYVSEYALTGECEGLSLSGRVDGYYANTQACYLEEIKTHRGNIARVGPGRRNMHWAQLKVYGALFCRRDQRQSVMLRLTYFEVLREEEQSEDLEFSSAELADFLTALCRDYLQWALKEAQHREQRDLALAELQFPFGEFRTGQRALSESVYKSLATERPLLLQAPTGIGKTVGVLFPALMAMPSQGIDRLFFLTSRNTGRALGLEGLRAISAAQSEATPIRVLELSAREHACDHPDLACHGESCPLAKGFFDRLSDARHEAVDVRFLDQAALKKIAASHQICRYFLAQEMAHWSDVVVADVNHYFDQHALLYALTRQNDWRVVPLVDEAHNLIDRARGMYSVALTEAQTLYTIKKPPAAIKTALEKLQQAWQQLLKPYLDEHQNVSAANRLYYLDKIAEDLHGALQKLITALTDYLSENAIDAELQQLLFTAIAFLRLADQFGDHSLCALSFAINRDGKAVTGSATLAIENLIPADHIKARFEDAHSAVLFSATLSPAEYYRDLLGMPFASAWQDIESPFHRSQIDLRLIRNISTRFDDRAASLQPIAQRIATQFESQPGNYLVFLSSFAYLNALKQQLSSDYPALPVIQQNPGMNTLQREAFIDEVKDPNPVIAFAVLGGVFSEGIDLPGEQLVGVYIATLGLPPHDDYHEMLRERLQLRFGDGYRYTYLYPGLRKVVQAAGRLIRTPSDRGIIELIDPRFSDPAIQALLPSWWELP